MTDDASRLGEARKQIDTVAPSMDRRSFLATFGAIMIAGCAGDGSTPTPTPTPEPTPTPTADPTATPTTESTPSPTPEPQRPKITRSSLLYKYRNFGDVLTKQFDAVGKGAQAIIGFRHETEVHDGTFDITEQVGVFGPDGNRVDLQRFDDEQLLDADGPREWEHALRFDTATWDLGDYRYEVVIRDNVTEKVSETASGRFEVTEPLGREEASLLSVDDPDTVAVDDDYSSTLELKNQSGRDGSVVTKLSTKYKSSSDWYTYTDTKLTVNLPAGGANTWESAPVSFDVPGTIQFRLDAIDEVWEVEVTDN